MATVNASEVMIELERGWAYPAMRDLIDNQLIHCLPLPHAQKFTIAVAQTATGSITRLFKAPAGAYLWRWFSTPSDMDTNVSPAIVYDIVATDDADVVKLQIIAGSTNAQAAAGTDNILAAAGGRYIGNQWVSLKVTTGAATGVAGTLKVAWMMSIGVITRSKRGTFKGDAFV